MSEQSKSGETTSFIAQLQHKMLGDRDAQLLFSTVMSNVALGFVIPFALQAGMGASMESSAIRAGVLGLTNGVVTLSTYGVALSMTDDINGASRAYGGASAVLTPIINTVAYGTIQQVFGARPQGATKDITFSLVSTLAVSGGSMAALLGVGLVLGLKDKMSEK